MACVVSVLKFGLPVATTADGSVNEKKNIISMTFMMSGIRETKMNQTCLVGKVLIVC